MNTLLYINEIHASNYFHMEEVEALRLVASMNAQKLLKGTTMVSDSQFFRVSDILTKKKHSKQ